MRRSIIKKGTWAEYCLRHYGPKYKPRPLIRPRPCLLRGLQAEGWRAYFAGKPCPPRNLNFRGRAERGKSWAYRQGWMKAKMSREQGKPSL